MKMHREFIVYKKRRYGSHGDVDMMFQFVDEEYIL